MREKKVVAFIVEGPSDEAALGSVMKEYFSGNEVQFIVVHGDITLKDYVSLDGIKKKINEQIEYVKKDIGIIPVILCRLFISWTWMGYIYRMKR